MKMGLIFGKVVYSPHTASYFTPANSDEPRSRLVTKQRGSSCLCLIPELSRSPACLVVLGKFVYVDGNPLEARGAEVGSDIYGNVKSTELLNHIIAILLESKVGKKRMD